MSKFSLRIRICSAALVAVTCSAGIAGNAHAGGVGPDDVSGVATDSGGLSTEDLGGTQTHVETRTPGTKSTSRASPVKTDQMNARQAVENGEARPFGWLLRKLKKAVPGDVVKVRLKRHPKDSWTYDVTILDPTGRYVLVSLNAATGAIISSKYR